ncbi:MAG: restriction endonuclease subunit S [Bacteroidales bacterium]|nr:restriction endonuclease subunit S [Bacteroidales bacterium]
MKDWKPENQNVNVKTLKESFLSSGRLDAEYYQSKYDALFTQLSKYDCDTLNKIVNTKKSVEPGSDAYQDNGIPFIRVSDVDKFGISEPKIFLSSDDFDLQELRPKKDTILLSKDGSVGIAYKVEKDLDCITSGALLHLTVFNKDYNPDYLTLVLNSKIVKMQSERDANGAIIQHWKPSEIEQVIIPKLAKTIQDDISSKIQKSFALKAESKRLLEEAKLLVEREIEKGGK